MLLCATLVGGRGAVAVGEIFPKMEEFELAGDLPATGGRIVLVDFWASWCAPCKDSFPAFARLHRTYGPRGLVIIAVSVDQKPTEYDGFIRKHSPPFAVLRDQGRRLVTRVAVPAMPTSYLLGRDGRVRFLHRGFFGKTTEEELCRQIETLLAEKA